jgi:large subunit ribosomal protein L30
MVNAEERYHVPMPAPSKRKVIRLKQIRSGIGASREMRQTLRALGLGKRYAFSELPDTSKIRNMIARVPHLVSILDGPDILFPREKSTLGEDRILEAVEAVRAARK